MKKISVIVPTYNEENNIVNCLELLSNQTVPRKDYEIIIVDGDSKDRTRKLAKKYADRVIIQKSKGIGGARNDGAVIAKGDIIATTDADCVIPENWLEKILKNLEDERYIAVCGSDWPVERKLKAQLVFFFLKNMIHLATFFNIYCLGGTNSAFRKDAFLKIGGYRKLSYSDDVELGFRMSKTGRIKYDRNMHVKLSVRRMEKQSYHKTLLTWLNGDIRLLLGKDIPEKTYVKLDYSQ